MNSQPFFAKDKRKLFGTFWLVAWLALGAFFLWKGVHPDETNSPQLNTNPASLNEDSSRPTKPIEQIRVGERVVTQLSERARVEAVRELGELPWWDAEQVDPATWRRIELTTTNYLGHPSQVVLLRPLRWLEEHQARAGSTIEISMPEQGVEGPAHVLSILPCPEIVKGEGCVVTGTFSHRRGDILNLHLAGINDPLGVTDNHPIWSEDQQKYVPAGELEIGERLRHLDGITQVTCIEHNCEEQPVYNLEIHGEHVYHVSTLGILVHNTTPSPTGYGAFGWGRPPSAPAPPIRRLGRAPEFPGGRLHEDAVLDRAIDYLGPGYREASPGRYVSADGLRQFRYGAHEVRNLANHHAHFEALDTFGRVIENTVVRIFR